MIQLGQGEEAAKAGKLLLARALKLAHNVMTNQQLVAQVSSVDTKLLRPPAPRLF